MSTIVEDPGIPLVAGVNGSQKLYTSATPSEVSVNPVNDKMKKMLPVGVRLAKRSTLFSKRKRSNDCALALALFGIALMIIETELSDAGVFSRRDAWSYAFKITISVSTVALLIFLGQYHKYDIQIYVIDNTVDDYRIAFSPERICKIILELSVCSIHPIPGEFFVPWALTSSAVKAMTNDEGVTMANCGGGGTTTDIPLEVSLSLPMVLRLYLILRTIMLHSKLFKDASSQSLGALNRVNFNYRFIFKSLMALYPDYILCIIMIALFVIASWGLRICEMYNNDEVHKNFLNTMWVIAITFLSVGYGDIVPSSYCGRTIAVITGIMGAGCTALVVAVLAKKLEMSRSEKYVHDFVIDASLVKKMHHEAANIVKAGWRVYKLKKQRAKVSKIMKYHRRLLRSIYNIRDLKSRQRRLADASITLVELHRDQQETWGILDHIRNKQQSLDDMMGTLDTKLDIIDQKLSIAFNFNAANVPNE